MCKSRQASEPRADTAAICLPAPRAASPSPCCVSPACAEVNAGPGTRPGAGSPAPRIGVVECMHACAEPRRSAEIVQIWPQARASDRSPSRAQRSGEAVYAHSDGPAANLSAVHDLRGCLGIVWCRVAYCAEASARITTRLSQSADSLSQNSSRYFEQHSRQNSMVRHHAPATWVDSSNPAMLVTSNGPFHTETSLQRLTLSGRCYL